MKSKLILFVIGFVVWILLSWPMDAQHALVGIVVAGIVAFLSGDLFTRRAHVFSHVERYLWFLYYVPMFIWECLKANVDVARRVLHPLCPINPGIVKVKTRLKSDTALTFLANSITLTPGTLTVDIDREAGILYVHWIDVKTKNREEATEKIVERFEKILEKIFD